MVRSHGLVSLLETRERLHLLHEPPDAERHVLWCGRTAGAIRLLPDLRDASLF
jgi:hypothetical protein